MKGAIAFLAVFTLVLVATLAYPSLPFGRQIFDAIGGADIDYPILGIPIATLVPAVFNGIVYGALVWLIYTVASGGTKRERGEQVVQQVVSFQNREKEVETQEEKRNVSEVTSKINIEKIEGIGPVYAKKLIEAGIKTTDDLLQMGSTQRGRVELAERTGISEKLILEWINLADLSRVQGIGEEYSDLLEEAGVDTVVELSKRNPESLYTNIQKVNEERNLVRRLPTLQEVTNWIEQAKKLPRKVEY